MFQIPHVHFPEVAMRRTALILAASAGWLCAQDVVYPTMIQWNGTRGLTQTRSAEPLGEGFLSISATGTGYQVDQGVAGRTAQTGTDIGVGIYSLGLGLSDWADLSGWFSNYMTANGDGMYPSPTNGLGSSGLQIQLSAPYDSTFPVRLAAQAGLIAGTSQNQLQLGLTPSGTPRADGWDYFETRTGYDLQARLLQTLRTGSVSFPVRMHLNEGLDQAVVSGQPLLVLLDGGVELDPIPALTIGLEGHTRTLWSNYNPQTDPTWATGSFTFHFPANVQFQVGGDFALSQTRSGMTDAHALDPWRAFVGVSVGIDLAANAREARATAHRNDSLERVALKAKIVADSSTLNSRIDSLHYVVKQRNILIDTLTRDSVRQALALEACRRLGSTTQSQDSAALAQARAQIEAERNKRSDLEASFLRTGMLNLDAVYFDLGNARIKPNSQPYLNLIGAILVKYPKLRFEVGGHTDNKGRPKTNLSLSKDRAEAVEDFLVQAHPELTGKIEARGYGDTKPKASNKTAEGRELNRRVEIKVTNLDALKEYTTDKP
jgi:outer membrane protein OmpA-like peptidoglycan-associated protein